MVRHIFLITSQKLSNAGQLKARLAVGGCAAAVDRLGFELPLRLSGVDASDKGREERGVVVVDQEQVGTGGSIPGGARTCTHPHAALELLVRVVFGDEVLKLVTHD